MCGDDRGKSSAGSAGEPSVPLDVIPLHSSNLLTVLDDTGVIRYESPAIERIYGFPQDELVGDPVVDYFHPEDRDRVLAAFRSLVERSGDAVEAVEYRHERVDGSYVWVESVGAADPTPNGNYVINTRDISARKARERELRRANERLERFTTIVTHDLRSPLAVAAGRVELASDACDTPHLEAAQAAHDRMEHLIESVMRLTRLEDDAVNPEDCSLADVADECWAAIRTGSATLRAGEALDVRADRSLLERLLENLFRNAVDHGRDDVTVRVGELDDAAGFFVADDGAGIPTERRESVFESGVSTHDDGAGLGLVIVSEVADAHGWSIAVTESADGGARFEVTGVEIDAA